jgi:hypothetical protein
MATIITGRDVTLEIDTDDFNPQTLSVTLSIDDDQQVYETFAGPVYKTLTQSYTLEIEMLADWGTTGSLCEALETAFDTDPDTSIGFEIVVAGVNNSTTVTGEVFPRVPAVTGSGVDASTVTITLPGNVNVDIDFDVQANPTPPPSI